MNFKKNINKKLTREGAVDNTLYLNNVIEDYEIASFNAGFFCSLF